MVAVLAGLRNAWESQSATVPLVVGVILIGIAVAVGPDLEELSGRYKETEFKLIRRGRALNYAEAVSTLTAGLPDTARLQLEQLAAEFVSEEELEATTPPRRRLSILPFTTRMLRRLFVPSAADAAPGSTEDRDSDEARERYFRDIRGSYLARTVEYTAPNPEYKLVGWWDTEQHVRIYMHFRWWGDWRVLCEAETPSGEISSHVLQGSVYMQGNNFYASYPDDFAGAGPLTPGAYTFTWKRVVPHDYPKSLPTPPTLRRDVVRINSEALTITAEKIDTIRSGQVSGPELEVVQREFPDPPGG